MPQYDPYARSREVLTPSALNARTRELIEGEFPLIWIEGEISNLARPSSGHLYFTLKDANAAVRCAMFRMRAMLLRVRPADGMRVLLRAKASLYEGRGEFQLVVEHLEEAGEGALRRAFEELKRKLQAEGLFEAGRKRAMPRFPGRIAVLTSPAGAALHDVLTVLRRRFPLLAVEVFAIPVQGADAAPRIVSVLRAVAATARHDAVLITRGGGSLEDLWPFNDERLARAIVASPVPVVSAIGHEVDFTIADFVADLRAPTPSIAAELLTPHRDDLARALDALRHRLLGAMARTLAERMQRLDVIDARLAAQRPAARLALLRERLERLRGRLRQAELRAIGVPRHRAALLRTRLGAVHPRVRLQQARERLLRLRRALLAASVRTVTSRTERLGGLARALNAVSPLATLDRGYAILFDAASGKVLRSAMDAKPGQALRGKLADGELDLEVK